MRELPVHDPPPVLPCYPCPHHAACCAFGTTLSDGEAKAISTTHGADKVYRTRGGEWRTRVKNRRCVFLVHNSCSIYDQPYYPAVCRGFPFVDAETGGPYEFDRTICPEFERRPELMRFNPYQESRADSSQTSTTETGRVRSTKDTPNATAAIAIPNHCRAYMR